MKQIIARFFCVWMLACPAMGLAAGDVAPAERYMEVIPPRYDDARDFHEGLAEVELDGKWGYIDNAGNEVIPPRYDKVEYFPNGLIAVRCGDDETGKWGFIDKRGNEVTPCKFSDAHSIGQELAAVKLDGKWGVMDKTGNIIVPYQYEAICPSTDGMAMVRRGESKTGKWGFIDNAGNETVPCKYDETFDFCDGLAMVGLEDGAGNLLWGFVDGLGREVIPCQYEWVGKNEEYSWLQDGNAFSEDLAYARAPGGGWGLIDRTGAVVAPLELQYDRMGELREGLMAVMAFERAGDPGAEVEEEDDDYGYDEEEEDDYEYAYAAKVGFIDTTGKLVIPLMYTCPYYAGNGCLEPEYIMPEFSEGLAAVMDNDRQESHPFLENSGKFGYIDSKGNVAIPFAYDYAAPFSEGLAYVVQDGKFGYIDRAGNVVVPLTYDCDYYYGCDDTDGLIDEQYVTDGLARISKIVPQRGMQYGLIDGTGNIVVPVQYDWICFPPDGPVMIYNGDGMEQYPTGFILFVGDEVTLVDKYEDVGWFSEGFAAVAVGDWDEEQWGFIDATGQEVVPCIYEDVRGVSEGLAAVQCDGEWGYIAIDQ